MKQKFAVILSVFLMSYVIADYSFDKSIKASSEFDSKEFLLGGNVIGIKLYSKGLICVDFEDISGENPAKKAGIEKGDVIISANGKDIENTDDFAETVRNSKNEINVIFDRNGDILETDLNPVTDTNGNKRVGMWVRDSIAGVGTVTFIDETDGKVVTLGHSVSDSDTGRNFMVQKGYITDCEIVSIEKSVSGNPGEIAGSFTEEEKIYGYITENTSTGLIANSSGIYKEDAVKVNAARKEEIKDGTALLYTDLAGDGVKPYAVEVKKLYGGVKGDMIVTITDERLLAMTGGIVQGMSGSPIIQNGKLIGAVTHVFVNDPTRGYGIFIENMLAEAEKIK